MYDCRILQQQQLYTQLLGPTAFITPPSCPQHEMRRIGRGAQKWARLAWRRVKSELRSSSRPPSPFPPTCGQPTWRRGGDWPVGGPGWNYGGWFTCCVISLQNSFVSKLGILYRYVPIKCTSAMLGWEKPLPLTCFDSIREKAQSKFPFPSSDFDICKMMLPAHKVSLDAKKNTGFWEKLDLLSKIKKWQNWFSKKH
jgi:hypothetical protein